MIHIDIHKQLTSSIGSMSLDLDLHIKKGDFVTIYGKSGAGKTSTFRILAGLMSPDEGKIIVDDKAWVDTTADINLSPQKRSIGLVFQDYALFPNMTVRENLEFALMRDADITIIDDLLELVELEGLQDRRPATLSGGQQQRVALARALVQKPQILLLDEPLSALDIEMRQKLQEYILKVHKEFHLTTIMISHDISEIVRMTDQVIQLEEGKVIKKGNPAEIFANIQVGGKFQFTGQVVNIVQQDFLFILTILIGKDLVKVVVDESEGSSLVIGDKVVVASKAYNPIVKKIGEAL
ncbi:MAG: ATP-binding cassette domain-containing protein [Bacteroidia bacterium]|nr:ATP-binding cassette domain-containing protein [Bacteroidia bacterium]